MTEEQSQEPVETKEDATTESIEDIANSINVEEQVKEFTAKPEKEPHYETPDPLDPDSWNRYTREQSDMYQRLNDTVSNMNQKIQTYEQQLQQQKISADVDKAVGRINTKLEVEPLLAEIALEKEYRQNPSFKKIWDNRDSNSQALEKALDKLSDKFSSVFNIKQDPQLTENQLAAKKSQQSLGRTPPEEKDSEWDDLTPSEFEARWNQLKRG